MGFWQFWWHTLIFSGQRNPPMLVELMMFALALMMSVAWILNPHYWPYLALCASYVLGSVMLRWVQEAIAPSSRSRKAIASLSLLMSLLFVSFCIAQIATMI